MVIRFATVEQLQAAASAVDVRLYNLRSTSPSRHLFVLRLNPAKRWQRLNHTRTRKVAAVCWHGHRDFFRELFKLAPSATVHTCRMGRVRYTAENFEDTYPSTGNANIGSLARPCRFADACEC